MKVHRFFVPEITGHTQGDIVPILAEPLVHQWRSVLKLQEGEHVELFDGEGGAVLGMIHYEGKATSVEITEKRPRQERTSGVTLCLALLKPASFDLALEKAVELGATRIIPVLADRSVVRKGNTDRMRKIAIEATEQSGGVFIPQIEEPQALPEVLTRTDLTLFVAERGSTGTTPSLTKDISILIGPEGGWTPREHVLFQAHHLPFLSLGDRTLRAETAAIVATAHIMLH